MGYRARVHARRSWLWLLPGVIAGVTAPLLLAQQPSPQRSAPITVVNVKEKDGQILSYRYMSGAAEVTMRGTKLAPEARIKLKVGSRPGFAELDINRGAISGLNPAQRFGKDFLTYVLWAVSVDGKASNLGEITFSGDKPISINVTTPYQTFWLMLTAEPDYAVADPSPQVVLYSTGQAGGASRALTIPGDLFFFTHYTDYSSAPGAVEPGPNELLQARKAVELASKSGVLLDERPAGPSRTKEEERTRDALERAKTFLTQAEEAYKKDARGNDVVQFARTAAQIAENARALALGAVGGVPVRKSESEMETLRAEAARLRAELAELRAAPAKPPAKPPKVAAPLPVVETKPEPPPPSMISRPVVWIGFLGWAVALLLLFRRRSA